jgi:hypothetical protein
VETERIAARLKIHTTIRDTAFEQRAGLAPYAEQMADIESTCLDVPRAAQRILQLAD